MMIPCVSGPNLNTKEHKVRVAGDSHLKEIAARIDQFLTSKSEVSSSIKPGANTEESVGTMEKDFKRLGKSGVIIINRGANDISSMRTQTISAVGKMTCFVQKYNNTNIIIVNIPHRYYLDRTSVVNSEIHAFNRQLL
jgi:lysophospholipase L1-like esterase